MKTSSRPLLRRSLLLAAIGVLVAVLTACTGRGGGYLPPQSPVFKGPASFGFSFSCEDKGGVNPPTGQLRIELAYTEHGSYLPAGSPFSIHGIVDTIDPVLESAICIGQNPPPGGNELIFLGRYRPMTSAPAGLGACPKRETRTSPLCRFEVIVRDNDGNSRRRRATSSRSSCPTLRRSRLSSTPRRFSTPGPATLAGGNLTVD